MQFNQMIHREGRMPVCGCSLWLLENLKWMQRCSMMLLSVHTEGSVRRCGLSVYLLHQGHRDVQFSLIIYVI